MSDVTYSGRLQGSDGSVLTVDRATLAAAPAPATPAADPVPATPTPSPLPAGWRQISAYRKMWPTSKYPGIAAAMGPDITEVRLAFAQGSPPALVGWGSQTLAQVVADCEALRARGVAISVSIGGAGGRVAPSSRADFVSGITSLHRVLRLDRIDWDVESGALNLADVVAVSQTLHDTIGIMCTMAPNGGNVGAYLPVGAELHRRGLLAAWGQQYYDAPVSLSAAMGRIEQSIAAGIPAEITQVGMMIGGDSRHWTLDVCESNMRSIRARWPSIAGAYLWSESQTDIAPWAARIRAALS